MKSFEEIWNFSGSIYGAFSPEEGKTMYDYAIKLLPESIVVEIGSYFGRSSSILGQIALDQNHELTCIDNFVTVDKDTYTEEQFKKNMRRDRVKYQLIPWYSKRAVKLFDNEEIDFLFIDGDHTYEGVKKDCELYIPKVKHKGLILFHDYNSSWDGVKKAVDERTDLTKIQITASMMVTVKN